MEVVQNQIPIVTEVPILCSPRDPVVRSSGWYSEGLGLESKLIPEFSHASNLLTWYQPRLLFYAVHAGNSSWKLD